VHFAWKLFALETAFDILVLTAFPEAAALLAFSHFSQFLADPVASEASVLLSPKCWTIATVNPAGSNLFIQTISPILISSFDSTITFPHFLHLISNGLYLGIRTSLFRIEEKKEEF